MSIISTNIDNFIQVYIPRQKSSQSFVTKMKCKVSSSSSHGVLISKEISYKSYREICSGEKKKVNLGHSVSWLIKDNSLVKYSPLLHIHARLSYLSNYWEYLVKFFSHHNIKPNWVDCKEMKASSYGHYDEERGEWGGCMGKV